MAYTTIIKVKAMFRDFATGTNVAVTDDEITEFIEEYSAIVEGRIAPYYDMDDIGAKSLLILDRIARLLTASQVYRILHTTMEEEKRVDYAKEGYALLDKIVPTYNCKCKRWDPPVMKLPDTDLLGVPEDPTGSKIKVSSTVTPTFQKGVDAW